MDPPDDERNVGRRRGDGNDHDEERASLLLSSSLTSSSSNNNDDAANIDDGGEEEYVDLYGRRPSFAAIVASETACAASASWTANAKPPLTPPAEKDTILSPISPSSSPSSATTGPPPPGRGRRPPRPPPPRTVGGGGGGGGVAAAVEGGGGGGSRGLDDPPSRTTGLVAGNSMGVRRPPPPNRRGTTPPPANDAISLLPPSSYTPSHRGDVDENDDGLDPWMGPNHRSSYKSSSSTKFDKRRILTILSFMSVGLALLLLLSYATSMAERDVDVVDTSSVVHAKRGDVDDVPGDGEGGMKGEKKRRVIGYHDASIENIYGANVYRKPRGVGYTSRPRGGLHPVYVVDVVVGEDDGDDDVYDDGLDYDWAGIHADIDEYYGNGSPYADGRLDMTNEERTKENDEWKNKMNEIRETYGYWNFVDDESDTRPVVDWMNVMKGGKTNTGDGGYDPSLGEISPSDFPRGTWQTDDVYVSRLIDEGRKLVNRVRDAMYDEVGWEDGGGIRLLESGGGGGTGGGETYRGGTRDGVVGWMYESSFRALSKKLLNAMITNDHFYVTLGGHSAAAGHGNNFRQSYMMGE